MTRWVCLTRGGANEPGLIRRRRKTRKQEKKKSFGSGNKQRRCAEFRCQHMEAGGGFRDPGHGLICVTDAEDRLSFKQLPPQRVRESGAVRPTCRRGPADSPEGLAAKQPCPALWWSFVGSKSSKPPENTCSRAKETNQKRKLSRQVETTVPLASCSYH